MERRQGTQGRGACAACFISKRKCDRKIPKCTQCQKQQVTCEPRIFRHWKGPHTANVSSPGRARLQVSEQRTRFASPQVLSGVIGDPPDNIQGLEDRNYSNNQLSLLLQSPEESDSHQDEITQWDNWNEVASMEDLLNANSNFQWNDTDEAERYDDYAILGNSSGVPLIDESTLDGHLGAPSPSRELPNSLSVGEPWSCPENHNQRTIPSELLDSIEKGFLWNHFIHRTILDIFCYDFDHPSNPPPGKNPFYAQLPHLAFQNRYVLSACLALSGSHYGYIQKSTVLDTLVSSLFREAEEELRRIVNLGQNNSADDLLVGLCIAQLLCTAQIRSGCRKLWKQYFGDVQTLLPWIHHTEPLITGERRKLIESLVRGFQYLDIISGVSFRSSRDCLSMSLDEILEDYQNGGSEWSGSPPQTDDSALLVDPLFAFSPRLVAPLKRLGLLIDAKARFTQSNDDRCRIPEGLESRITSLEEDLLHAYESDIKRFRRGSSDAKELLYCNLAFHAASHILFYARLRDLPSTAALIRSKVRDVIVATKKIPSRSRTSAALAFPLFTAGCEAVDSGDRREISGRLLRIKELCLSDIFRMHLILRRIWDLRDMAPHTSWITWLPQVEDSFGECILF